MMMYPKGLMIMKHNPKMKKTHNAGVTLIELLISIAVGSLVLMMLMQMVVMNITARRVFEYQNKVTEQSLLITDVIRKNLNTLQPQRVDRTETATEITITFTHEYDITLNSGTGALERTPNADPPDVLVYNKTNQTLTYNGVLLHSSNLKILSGSTITLDYYQDTVPNPLTCSDITEPKANSICGDGIVTLTLIIAWELNGILQETYTFTTNIIV